MNTGEVISKNRGGNSKVTMEESSVISMKQVGVSFGGHRVLEDVNVSVASKEFLLLTGPNGGGKTTLIRLMLGLLKPTVGCITRRDNLIIGYLSQYQQLDKQFPISVQEVVSAGLLSRKKLTERFSSKQRQQVLETIEAMGLGGLEKQPIAALSGGQLQRVLFARALVSQPELLVLDEPDTYLDSAFKEQLVALLQSLAGRCAIVLVTHNPHGIERLADHILRVDRTVTQVSMTDVRLPHAGHADGD